MGKDALFGGLFGLFMKHLGGIPVDRSSPHGVVNQIADRIKISDKIVVALSPSGTRKRMDYWRSGFYWIALTAEVPILCGFLDFKRKEAGVGLTLQPSGDVVKDMDQIREFYSNITGKHPELTSIIRLKEENTTE